MDKLGWFEYRDWDHCGRARSTCLLSVCLITEAGSFHCTYFCCVSPAFTRIVFTMSPGR